MMFIILFLNIAQADPHVLTWPEYANNNHILLEKNVSDTITCQLIKLMYIDKSTILQFKQIKHNPWLSDKGSMQWLPETHEAMICDTLENRRKMQGVLEQLNQPPQQIKIRAKIISVDRSYLHDLGVNFQTSAASAKSDGASGVTDDLGKGGLRIVLGSLMAQQLLSAQIHALVQSGHAKVMASPSILTSNNKAANIESGEEVPYQQGALSGGTSIAFKKAVLQLAVTPQLTSTKTVNLVIQVHQDKVTTATVNGVPIISTEQLSTTADIKKDNLLLLGGIIEKQYNEQKEGVPFLRHIPILGAIFSHKRKEVKEKELLILLQPDW